MKIRKKKLEERIERGGIREVGKKEEKDRNREK